MRCFDSAASGYEEAPSLAHLARMTSSRVRELPETLIRRTYTRRRSTRNVNLTAPSPCRSRSGVDVANA